MKQGKLRMLLRNVINFLFEVQRPYVGFIRFCTIVDKSWHTRYTVV